MHYFGIPLHTRSMIAYKILLSIWGNSSKKLHRGNVVNIPYSQVSVFVVSSLGDCQNECAIVFRMPHFSFINIILIIFQISGIPRNEHSCRKTFWYRVPWNQKFNRTLLYTHYSVAQSKMNKQSFSFWITASSLLSAPPLIQEPFWLHNFTSLCVVIKIAQDLAY